MASAWPSADLLGAVRAGAESPIPTYIPEEVAKKLPLYQRFPVRLITEVHRAADQNEVHPAALRALALGRTVPAR